MTRQQIQQAIETFRKITMANTITPENVGVLLRALLDFATNSDEAAQAAANLLTGYSLHAKPTHDSITVTLRNALGNIVGQGCKIPLAEGSTDEAGLLSPREKEQIDDNRLDIVQLAADLDESTHELYSYIDQADLYITTDLTKKITAAGTKAAAADKKADSALELAESLDILRGEPGGLATLDDNGHLDPGQINPDTVSVRVFHGFVENVTVETVGTIVKPGLFTQVVYDTARRKFLFYAGGYYEAWPEASAYNGLSGEIPENRLYVYAAGRSIWWWNGAELTKLADLPANEPRGPLVCMFDGWTDESPALGALVPGQGRGEVIYDRERGTFVSHEMVGNSYGWFGEWTGDASFGEPLGPFQGVRPVADRFYFCPTGSGLWWWDGTQLIDVSGCSGSGTPPAITPGEIDDLLQSSPAPPEPPDTEPPSITLDEIDELLRP